MSLGQKVPEKADVIVVGLGAMGSAACYHLAKTGCNVIGIEQFSVGHDQGSSHGETRLIRKAYFEHPNYVPLLLRAYDLWAEVEHQAAEQLLYKTGLILYGDENSSIVAGCKDSAKTHDLELEELDYETCLERYPFYRVPEGFSGVFEPDAGFLKVEACNLAHVKCAKKLGAKIFENTPVESFGKEGGGVFVKTSHGTFHADKLVFTSGAWTASLLQSLNLPLTIHRMALGWFAAPEVYSLEKGVPSFGLHWNDRFFYGFPRLDGKGLKVGDHTPESLVGHPSELQRQESPNEFAALKPVLKNFLSEVDEAPYRSAICMYTMTPDEHFIIDQHPENEQILIAGGFSGHGFKFASVVGESLAQMATQGRSEFDLDFFKLSRFGD